MRTIYHYTHIVCEVFEDLYIFGRFVWRSILLYTRAAYEVALELWNEFVPTKMFKEATFPSLNTWVPEYETEESPRLLMLLLIAAPFVILFGSLWFLFMLVFIGT